MKWPTSIGIGGRLRAESLADIIGIRNLAEQLGRRGDVASCVGYIGRAYLGLDDPLCALDHFYSALAISRDVGEMNDVALWTANIGQVHATPEYGQYDPRLAEQMLTQAFELYTAQNDRTNLVEVHEMFAKLYRQLGDWQKADHHTTRQYYLKEQIQGLEAITKAYAIEHRRQMAEVEKQRVIERAEAKAAEEVQRMKAEEAERELGNATLHLLAQTQLLRDLRNDLQKIVRKIPPSEPVARELRERIKSLSCDAVDWDRFDRQFKSVHPGFIRALIERAPGLTATEVRICTMLRMNLKSHEIAQIFCISEAGVDFHRSNIRRKLGLKREDKLPVVLGSM